LKKLPISVGHYEEDMQIEKIFRRFLISGMRIIWARLPLRTYFICA